MPRGKAVDRAREILNEAGVSAPPVPVHEIAQRHDLRIVERVFDGNVSGMLVRKKDRGVIVVNPRHVTTRQRFTIAHELGHFILHDDETFIDHVRVDYRDERSGRGTERQEIDANKFAAELLMPEDMVRAAHRQQLGDGPAPASSDFVAELAETFDVSHEAMTFRLVNLGLSRQV